MELGNKLITMLDKPREHFKRFVRGVGLPPKTKIDEVIAHCKDWPTWPAWPGAAAEMNLRYMWALHRNAWCRSEIAWCRSEIAGRPPETAGGPAETHGDYANYRRRWYSFLEHVQMCPGGPDGIEKTITDMFAAENAGSDVSAERQPD